ncbi:phospholipid-transporting ATPase ABCA7 isoform X3 [Symphalangus syndactylus]|uniref:phospholipid-transporting ATPase ABCA7 isoform X3 n=1 Tax=Symphalangus syndactylus TaxID=9590 RepID=UPI002442AB39|nr:phospholipid-transporting ATPase ABCA7-like [Symphalangus syndactylus]XP_055103079.1 phospholipid-transporting ATPase ABCA7-like [Symphalangus syndactylus]XP_055103080.1 phospholipid-transporting ATPase ABCA7-like [Symphalangus syndactylus]XP_055103081.1 phospholipid-transporting ATPase ABCA7-like [Symphalangus syndactylus]XP_055103082.1 phospholipid-transporting ATPase ABCA7-like [Symphalangus syndactylus]
MAFWTQLMLLLWKNFMYRRRQPVQLLVELLWPLFLFFILVAVRHSHPPLEHHECHFPNKPLPSAGTVPWLQGLICNVNNTCFPQLTPGEEPGRLSNFNDSLVSRLLADARTVLGGASAHRMLAGLGKLIATLRAARSTAQPQPTKQSPLEPPMLDVAELLTSLLRTESLGLALGQAQEPLHSLLEAAEDLAQELLALHSLMELQALLQRPRGTSGPLELLSEALCSARGPSSTVGPSLNWYEASDLMELVGQEPESALPDSSLSPACSELIGALDSHPLSRLLWRRLKPLILGKLLFAPDTPFTRKLMAQVNRTFEELSLLRDVREVWEMLGPRIFTFMNDSSNVAVLQRLLQMQDEGRRQPRPGGRDHTEALRSFLEPGSGGYSWQDAHADVGRLVGTLGRVTECLSLDKLEAAPSEAALVSRALQLLAEHRFWAGVVFLGPEDSSDPTEHPTADLGPSHVRIKIRMDIDAVTRTNKIRDRFWDPGPAADPLTDLRYVWGGFVYLQDLVERAAVRLLSGANPRAGLYLQQMPYPCYVDDVFLRVLSRSLPLFLTLAWIYSVTLTVKAVVREKETRLRDTMRAMGLSRAVLWLGWFLSCLGPFLLSAALLVLVLKLGDILPYSHPGVVFLFLAAFAVATVTQSFLLSAFFSRANLAAACGGLAYFSLYLPYVLCVAWRDRLPAGGRVAASLLSPVAFGFGCESLALLEEQGEGAQWHNAGTRPTADVFSLAQVSGLLLLDAALYGLATWYLEAVCPGQYGIPEPWNFPFRRSYWCGPRPPKSPAPCPTALDPKVLVEEAPLSLRPGVSVRGLEKCFPGSPQPALRGLSLDFYQGHITAFLGHNGAGKTTTLSILSGLFPPSGGSAFILGHDVRSSMATIRPHLGVCPQYNVLFDMLTVGEHVWFYGRLKGLSATVVGPEQDRLLQDVGLVSKQSVQTRHLSGGMQRKLSVAIAFVGGSQVVILDEPTAGVDPASRRSIWELLLKYREGRTLILSTHHLDEAELLGDRVAVVAGGRLCCCGSPLFLRRHLGSGYYLRLVKARLPLITNEKADTDMEGSVDTGQDKKNGSQGSRVGTPQLLALVQHWVPGARLVEELPHELVLVLPYTGAHDGSFATLFQELDTRLAELRLTGYGISDTSLEEIFLKVVEECAADTNMDDGCCGQHLCTGIAGLDVTLRLKMPPEETALENREPAGSAPETQALQGSGPHAVGRVQGWALTRQQLQALLLKRFLLARRSRRGLFAQIVLPALFVGLALVFSLIVPPFGHYPALRLSPTMYGAQVSFFSEDAPGDPGRTRLLEALLEEAGLEEPTVQHGSNRFSAPEVPAEVAKVLASSNWTPESPSPACQCSRPGARRLLPDCPAAAGGPPPPQAVTGSGEVIQNLTGRNLSDFLVKTYPRLVRQGLKTKKWVNEVRYGGFSLGGRDPGLPSGQELGHSVEELWALLSPLPGGALDRVLKNLTAWAHSLDAQDSLKIWFNNKGWHSMVAFVNRANNAILRAHLPPGPARHTHSITTLNHPLNLTKEQLSEAALMASSVDVLVSICVVFAMSFVPASFTLVLIEERVTRAKHLQLMGGLSPTLYWLGNFLWDMCNYLVPACIVVLIFLAFQQRAYVAPANLPALLLLLLLYGWSITPLMYPASFFFSVPSTAYVVLTCINLFIGINGSMATFVLELFSDQKLQEVSRILKQVFLIFPHFCLGRGLIDMVRNQAMADAFERLGDRQFQSPLRWEVVGKNLLAMVIQGPLFLLFTLLLQHRSQLLPQPKVRSLPLLGEEDEDVARERERVVRGATQGDVLVLRNLTKVYRGQRMPAVDRLCLGIPPGECFGLLGVNGAGKTSTFRMVTGDTLASGGEAVLAGHSVAQEPSAAHLNMGYCPQSDAIFELLTGREHLELFARLRGVPEPQVAQTAGSGLARLGLSWYADRPAGTYSGGNKRKLATAVALVGDPAVVFLDEPTTGMDPSARRFLWNSLLAVVREGRSVMLTSHSMEECEALCSRLAIMVNGRFRCLGSPQHLKDRFAAGHTLTLRVPAARSQPAAAFVAAEFPGAELREAHGGRLRFQLPPGGRCALARVFGELAVHGAEHGVEDFSVSQTMLEEVFLYFSKDQGKDEDTQEQKEAGVGVDPAPGLQHPKRISQFLDDLSTAETVL